MAFDATLEGHGREMRVDLSELDGYVALVQICRDACQTALVMKVKDGEDTWDAVFSGGSPHGALLRDNLSTLVAEHELEIAEACEDLLDEEKGDYL